MPLKIDERTAILAMALSLVVNPGWFAIFDLPKSGNAYTATLIAFSACVGFVIGGFLKLWGQWNSTKYAVLILFISTMFIFLMPPMLKSSI